VYGAGTKRRLEMTESQKSAYLVGVKKRAGKRKVTPQLTQLLKTFVFNHPNIRTSPISSDTLKVPNEDGVKVDVPKLLLEISRTELYLQFKTATEEYNKAFLNTPAKDRLHAHPIATIGERTFRYLLPPQCRKMDERHMEMCACADCRGVALIHGALRAWRLRRLARLKAAAAKAIAEAAAAKGRSRAAARAAAAAAEAAVDAYQPPDDAKASMVRSRIMCADACDAAGKSLGFAHAACWMNRCPHCKDGAKYHVPEDEQQKGDGAEMIQYHVYDYVEETTQYTKDDGTPKTRKVKKLKKKEMTIGEFHEKVYKPMVLIDDKYHGNLFRLLNVCRLERLAELTPGDIEAIRDFSEKLASLFPNEPQFLHWQNTDVTIEVSVLTAFLKDAVERFENGEAVCLAKARRSQFFQSQSTILLAHQKKTVASRAIIMNIQLQ
jgi:hypothetical protein